MIIGHDHEVSLWTFLSHAADGLAGGDQPDLKLGIC